MKELIPTVQFYSTNPRNSAINIRGLGAPFGLTNDGIEPGVGLYIDGVFYARPAAATLDFLDVERIEVLRGPQGTLFGKNTTAGAINVTTRRPTLHAGRPTSSSTTATSDFVQAKGSISGPLVARRSPAGCRSPGTQRDGTVYSTATQQRRERSQQPGRQGPGAVRAVGQDRDHGDGGLHAPAARRATRRSSRASRPRCAPPNRQYPQIAADLGYTPPSFNAFDRLTDVDTPLRSYQDLGGSSLTVDWKLGPGRLTSTTAWRYWDWNPSNDRDFIGLPVTTISAAPSKQRQWTQEVRYAGRSRRRI